MFTAYEGSFRIFYSCCYNHTEQRAGEHGGEGVGGDDEVVLVHGLCHVSYRRSMTGKMITSVVMLGGAYDGCCAWWVLGMFVLLCAFLCVVGVAGLWCDVVVWCGEVVWCDVVVWCGEVVWCGVVVW